MGWKKEEVWTMGNHFMHIDEKAVQALIYLKGGDDEMGLI